MTVTRANIETTLVARASALMAYVSMAITVVGTNADLADPISFGILECGESVADITNPTTAEVAACANPYKLLALAEFRLLENIAGNLAKVDTTLGPRSERLSQLAALLEARMKRLSDMLKTKYGIGAAVLTAGYIDYNIASHSDSVSEDE